MRKTMLSLILLFFITGNLSAAFFAKIPIDEKNYYQIYIELTNINEIWNELRTNFDDYFKVGTDENNLLEFTEAGLNFIKAKALFNETISKTNGISELDGEPNMEVVKEYIGINYTDGIMVDPQLICNAVIDGINHKKTEEITSLKQLGDISDTILEVFDVSLIRSFDKITGGQHLSSNGGKTAESRIGASIQTFKWGSIAGILLFNLLVVEIVIMGIMFALKHEANAGEILLKAFECIVLVFVLTNLFDIVKLAYRIGNWGARNAADSMNNNVETYDDTSDDGNAVIKPSAVMKLLMDVMGELSISREMILNSLNDDGDSGFLGMKKALKWLLYMLLFFVMYVAFGIIYGLCMFYIILWQVELKVMLIVAAFLLPFQIFRMTKFMAKGIWPVLLGQCIKLFTATFVLNFFSGITDKLFVSMQKYVSSSGYSLTAVCMGYCPGMLMISLVFAYFLLKSPDMAKAFIVGQPTTDSSGAQIAMKTGTKAIGLSMATPSIAKFGGKMLDKTAAGGYGATQLVRRLRGNTGAVNAYKAFRAEAVKNRMKAPSFTTYAFTSASKAIGDHLSKKGK